VGAGVCKSGHMHTHMQIRDHWPQLHEIKGVNNFFNDQKQIYNHWFHQIGTSGARVIMGLYLGRLAHMCTHV
jgi:hypothetical protein